jgi:peptide/nickel transport system permease protein
MSRIIRSATLGVRGTTYVEAARALGAGTPRLILRHTLPNILAPALVVATLAVGNAVLAEAALSFLGFGITPPTPSWGEMLSASGRQYMQVAPWLAIFPGLAISITVFSYNMLGDALRDVLDPRMRGT